VQVRTLPDIAAIASGKVKVQDVREIDIADLLGRESVPPDQDLMRKNIDGRVVMVTGAGGSIGAELCRQIAMLDPKMLVLFEQSEFNLYTIDRELGKGKIKFVTEQCIKYGVSTIFHAAAYKHVPLVEANPEMGVKNNIVGTHATAMAAIAAGVDSFVLISTDKAVRPTNVMGATKRFAELMLQSMNADPIHETTKFIIVRFGNVIDSSGSVIPLFRAQINMSGPVTVTHPDITRYFMTIPEASQLVIQAGAMGKGGEVFVLDMGETVKIWIWARQ
jgi:FlaA1/EpsC-like NDP-sugar epimerase